MIPTAEGVGVNGGAFVGETLSEAVLRRLLFFGVDGGTGGGGMPFEVAFLLFAPFVVPFAVDIVDPLADCLAELAFRFLSDVSSAFPFGIGVD